jgi:hypothetical protein
MAGKTAITGWGGHRVLRRSVMLPRASRLKEASHVKLISKPHRATTSYYKVNHKDTEVAGEPVVQLLSWHIAAYIGMGMRKSPVGSAAIQGAKAFMYNYLTYVKAHPRFYRASTMSSQLP